MDDKTVVITGAASGIGLALAKKMSGQGHRLVLADVDRKRLRDTKGKVDSKSIFVDCDVSKESDCEELARVTHENFGAPQLLFNNAGVISRFASMWEQPSTEWERVLSVNVQGVANVLRVFVPSMLSQQASSHIINTASEAALTSRGFVGTYHASKHAVLAMTEALAQELSYLGAKVRVSVLCPGGVNTGVLDGLTDEVERTGDASGKAAQALERAYRRALPKAMSPDDVAERVLQGVVNGDFYIFSHPEVALLPELRASAVKENVYPSLPAGLQQQMAEQRDDKNGSTRPS